MAIKGSLKEASLADVCQLLALGQRRPAACRSRTSRASARFISTRAALHTRVVNRRDRIRGSPRARRIAYAGSVTSALEIQSSEPDKRLGQVRPSKPISRPARTSRFTIPGFRSRSIPLHLFTWSRGNFFFEADELPEADILVSISPTACCSSRPAGRRVEPDRERRFDPLDLIFEVDIERLLASEVELTPEQETVARLFDGTRSVEDAVEVLGIDEFDVGRALYGLIQARVCRTGARRSRLKQPMPRAAAKRRFWNARISEWHSIARACWTTPLVS